MAGKMAKNMLFIVFNYFEFKGFLKSISQVCFDDFAVKVINIESRSPTKIEKIVWHLLDSRVGVKHESS